MHLIYADVSKNLTFSNTFIRNNKLVKTVAHEAKVIAKDYDDFLVFDFFNSFL